MRLLRLLGVNLLELLVLHLGVLSFFKFLGAPASTSAFGAQSTTAPAPFGQQTQPGGLFGAKPNTGGFSFSQPAAASAPTGGLFGATTTSAPLFGALQQQAPAGSLFGAGTTTKTGIIFMF